MNLLYKLSMTLILSLTPFFYAQANDQYVTNNSDQRFWAVMHNNHVNGDTATSQWLEPGGQIGIHNNDESNWDDDGGRRYGFGKPFIILYQNEGDENNPDKQAIGQFGLRITKNNGYTSLFASCYYTAVSLPASPVNFISGEAIGVYQWFGCRDARIENWPEQ